jgi:photosystem II stability/assembly factor-like uncharacterized protein
MTSLPAGDAGIDIVVEGVFEIRIAPSDSDTMYMALRGYVYETTNGGTTWSRTNFAQLDPNDSMVANGVADRYAGEKMAVDPNNADVVLVGSRLDGMFYTDDGGASWSSVAGVPAGSTPGITGICFDDTSSVVGGKTQIVYASSAGNGIYRSANGGASWTRISDGTGGTPREGALHATCANGKYYVTNNVGQGYLWRYSGLWTDIEPSPGQARSHSITVDPNNPNRLVVGMDSGHVLVSRDDGASWDPIIWTMTRNGVKIPWHGWTSEAYMSNGDMQFDPSVPGKVLFAEGIGVWHTTLQSGSQSSLTWSEDSVGIEQIVANVVSAPPGSGTIHLAGWDRGVFTTSDVEAYPSTHGQTQSMNHAYWAGHAADDPSTVVVFSTRFGTDYSAISTDAGATWNQLADTPVTLLGGSGAVSTASNFILIGANNGPGYYTTNGGSTWKALSLPGTTNANYSANMWLNRHIVVADSVTPNKFYLYKCINLACAFDEGLFRSVDGGATWTRIRTTNLAAWDGYSNAKLKAVPGKAGHLFYTAGWVGGIGQANPGDTNLVRSTDSGDTWSAVANVKEVYDFGFGDVQPSGYPSIFIAGWVGGEWGIWRSDDAAGSWTKIGEFPLGSFDLLTAVEGAKDGTGRVYLGFRGSGYAYGTPSTGGLTPPQAPILLP